MHVKTTVVNTCAAASTATTEAPALPLVLTPVYVCVLLAPLDHAVNLVSSLLKFAIQTSTTLYEHYCIKQVTHENVMVIACATYMYIPVCLQRLI